MPINSPLINISNGVFAVSSFDQNLGNFKDFIKMTKSFNDVSNLCLYQDLCNNSYYLSDVDSLIQYKVNLSWNKKGQTIVSIGTGYSWNHIQFSEIISINGDGSRVALGNSAYSNKRGAVEIFEHDSTNNSWYPLGSVIHGTRNRGYFGHAIALNDIGDILVIGHHNGIDNQLRGAVHIYNYDIDLSDWKPTGIIEGSYPYQYLGSMISINKDASVLVLGGKGADAVSYCDVYDNINNNWKKRSKILHTTDKLAPGSIGLNGSGSRVAVSAWGGGVAVRGQGGECSIYEYNEHSNSWTQLGSTIFGVESWHQLASSVDLNEVGDRLVLGQPHFDNYTGDAGYNTGRASVYEYSNGTWNILGNHFDNPDSVKWLMYGCSVSINDVGNRIVIGAPESVNIVSGGPGYLQVYQYNESNSSWDQLGSNIDGDNQGQEYSTFGTCVACNANCTIVGGVRLHHDINGDSNLENIPVAEVFEFS